MSVEGSTRFLIGLFVFLLLSCMSYLYILEIKPLSVVSFANIFSQSIGYLLILFMVSFVVQKLVSLIRSHLFIFAFISIALRDWQKKTLGNSLAAQWVKDLVLSQLWLWLQLWCKFHPCLKNFHMLWAQPKKKKKSPWYTLCQIMFFPWSPLGILQCHVLCSSVSDFLSLFLCMVWECVPISLKCMWLSNFSKYHLLKRLAHCIFLPPLLKINEP